MTRRKMMPQRDDYPRPWEHRPINQERWNRHRARLMAESHPGHHPEEWWHYEAPEARDLNEAQGAQLFAMGELSEAELAALMLIWRERFEQAQEPSFSYCRGAGDWLKGAAARKAFYRWAGIPDAVLAQFEAELADA